MLKYSDIKSEAFVHFKDFKIIAKDILFEINLVIGLIVWRFKSNF